MNSNTADELGSIFTGALTEVILKTTGFLLEDLQADRAAEYAEFRDIVGAMSLNSKKSGMLFVSADERCLRVLCSYFIGVPIKDITRDDLLDALCELVNMTAGNAKISLSDPDYMYSLSSPFAISGIGLSIDFKKRTNVISRVLSNGDISVKIAIVY